MKVLRLKNSSLEPGLSSGLRWSPVGFVSVCTYGLLLLHSVAQPESSQCEQSKGCFKFFCFFGFFWFLVGFFWNEETPTTHLS